MKNTYFILLIFFFFSTYLITAQEKNELALNESINVIKDLAENNNYDSSSYEDDMSTPFKNTKASVIFDQPTGVLKMSNMGSYGTRGKSNMDIELYLKKISPTWIIGFVNDIDKDYSGFLIELSDYAYGEALLNIDEGNVINILKEGGKSMSFIEITNFKGTKGLEIANALKDVCSLLYENNE